MDTSRDKDEVEPVDLSNVMSKCIALVSSVNVMLDQVELTLNLINEQKNHCWYHLQEEGVDFDSKPCSLLLQCNMFFHDLFTNVKVTEAPKTINRDPEVEECGNSLSKLLCENEWMEEFLSFLESPLDNSVDDTDTVAKSEQVDEKHEVLVVLVNFWELDDN